MLLAALSSSNREGGGLRAPPGNSHAAQRIVGRPLSGEVDEAGPPNPQGIHDPSGMPRLGSHKTSPLRCWRRPTTAPVRCRRGRATRRRVQLSCNTMPLLRPCLAEFGHEEIAFIQRVVFRSSRGRSSEAEHQLPKLRTRVRFSSPALSQTSRSRVAFGRRPLNPLAPPKLRRATNVQHETPRSQLPTLRTPPADSWSLVMGVIESAFHTR
jgi:hypothetical protein